MVKKRAYRAVNVNTVDIESLRATFQDKLCVCGVDVAKTNFVAALLDADKRTVITVKWQHPTETMAFLQLLQQLKARRLDIALESSGSYGDPLRYLLDRLGVQVFRVSTKRSHDAAELFDGVPSWHDAKSAALLGRMHLDGISERWPLLTEQARRLDALAKQHGRYVESLGRVLNRLSAELARHWPELTSVLSAQSRSCLELLAEMGSAQRVVAEQSKTRELLLRVSKRALSSVTVERVIDAARTTLGVVPLAEETTNVRELAAEALRLRQAIVESNMRLASVCDTDPMLNAVTSVVGKTTAVRLIAETGDPRHYSSAGAYEKTLGLNLKERSSGTKKGRLSISKRGSPMARSLLFLAALRMVQNDATVRAWHERKIRRDGSIRIKSIVAIMRKLARAIWHVAKHGGNFDSNKLFDPRRLDLSAVA